MRLNEIIDRFSLVSGLERKEISRLLPVIIDCKELFEERIIRELTRSEERRAVHACAVYAYYRTSLISGGDAVSSFKAGDVQLETNADKTAARSLWEEEKAAVADIVALDDGFSFKAVRV